MSKYTLRVTVAAPEALISAANQLALAIGESRDDDRTFQSASYQDAAGNRYAIASTVAVSHFPVIASSSLEQAAIERFGADHPVDLTLAQQAQLALSVWAPTTDTETGEQILGPQATAGAITAVVHPDPSQAIQWLGLSGYSETTDE